MGIVIKGVFNMNGRTVSTINEVSDYFLSKEEMTPKKLQKICYYAYAWYLTLYEDYLFDNGKFEAWVHGPVNVELYSKYKMYGWKNICKKNEPKLIPEIKEFLNIIYNTFSGFSGDELENMTHNETPWIEARQGLDPEVPCNYLLNDTTIIQFYKKLGERGQVE